MLRGKGIWEEYCAFSIFHNIEQEVLPRCLQEATMSEVSQVEGITQNQSTQRKH